MCVASRTATLGLFRDVDSHPGVAAYGQEPDHCLSSCSDHLRYVFDHWRSQGASEMAVHRSTFRDVREAGTPLITWNPRKSRLWQRKEEDTEEKAIVMIFELMTAFSFEYSCM